MAAASPTIDVHAHILDEDMMQRIRKEAPGLRLELTEVGPHSARLQIGDIVQTPYPRGGWDLEKRLADMEGAGVDMQVVSALPQTFLYDLEAKRTLAIAAAQNEAIAALVKRMPQHFLGLAMLPMQSPELAAAELERSITKLGLRGAMICSHIEGRNLDDPSLDPVWHKAEELGAFLLVHPQKVAASDRLGSYYAKNLIGNPLETTIAAGSLVFGGVLERYPRIKFMLSHGGGFFPYQAGRWAHGWAVRPEPKDRLPVPPDVSMARFYYDTILHATPQLEFLIGQAGAAHIVLGSDYPFDMGMLDCVRFVRRLGVHEEIKSAIMSANPARLLRTAATNA